MHAFCEQELSARGCKICIQLGNTGDMSIEFEAVDGSRETQTLFEAKEIKVVKLVLGTSSVLLTTSEHEEGSKALNLNVCLWSGLEQQGSAQPLQPAGSIVPCNESQKEAAATQMQETTKEDFANKLRGWMMALASLFASMTFQAGINPPMQFQPDAIMSAQNPVQRIYQGRFFLVLNSIVFTYSIVLVMLMLFQSSLSLERLVGGRRGFFSRSKRGLLCSNIIMLLVVFGLGSSSQISDMFIPLFGCSVLLCTMYYEKVRDKCKHLWKKLREVFLNSDAGGAIIR